MIDGMRVMGMRAADIEAQQDSAGVDADTAPAADFEVYEDAWDSLQFFLRVQTQWTAVSVGQMVSFGMGSSMVMQPRRVGLNYAGVESAARMAGVRRALLPGLLADLQVMEHAVLKADAEMAAALEG